MKYFIAVVGYNDTCYVGTSLEDVWEKAYGDEVSFDDLSFYEGEAIEVEQKIVRKTVPVKR